MSTIALLLALAAAPQLGAPPAVSAAPPVLDLVEVHVPTRAHFARLCALGADLAGHGARPAGAEWVRALGSDAEQDAWRAAGLEVRVVREDLTAWYAARAASDLPPGALALGSGSLGGFKTLPEMYQWAVQLAFQYPSRVSLPIVLGQSHEGRDVWAFRVSTSPGQNSPATPTVWYDALHHAREPVSAEVLLRFAEELASGYGHDAELTQLVQTRDFVFIPCVNPDGYEYNRVLAPGGGGLWRKNKRLNPGGTFGVDLNRNYDWQWGPLWPLGSSPLEGSSDYHGPSAFSEPETVALRDFCAQELPRVAVSLHSYADAWVFPWGYDAVLTPDDAWLRDLTQRAASPPGWTYGAVWEALYFANGSSIDWMYGAHGTLAVAAEIGSDLDGYWPPPSRVDELYAEARVGLVEAARRAGTWLELSDFAWQEAVGDGDAWPEPGESWQLTVEVANVGLDAANGTLGLAASGASLAPAGGALPVQLAAGASAWIGPLVLDVASNAPSGVTLRYDVELGWDGAVQRTPREVVLGEPRVLVEDDMQASDFGFTTDGPGLGAWERRVPHATGAQPGLDASGLANGRCWVTGAKAGPPDANDVDGARSLETKTFAVAGAQQLELELATWFTAGGAEDRFVIEASNDGGATWHALREVTPAPTWQTQTIDVDAVLPTSDQMRLRFSVEDVGPDSTVEACVDDLVLRTLAGTPTLALWGKTSPGQPLRYFVHHSRTPNQPTRLLWALSAGPGVVQPGIGGRFYLTGSVRTLDSAVSDADGRWVLQSRIPALSSLKGLTLYLQALSGEGGPYAAYSNLLRFTIE